MQLKQPIVLEIWMEEDSKKLRELGIQPKSYLAPVIFSSLEALTEDVGPDNKEATAFICQGLEYLADIRLKDLMKLVDYPKPINADLLSKRY